MNEKLTHEQRVDKILKKYKWHEDFNTHIIAQEIVKALTAHTEDEPVEDGFRRVKKFAQAAGKWEYLENQIALRKIKEAANYYGKHSRNITGGEVEDYLQQEDKDE